MLSVVPSTIRPRSTTPSPRRSGPTSRRVGLQPTDVVDAALAIVSADGADALSMRRLAADLGVTTTTIYWHVGNREQLVVAVVERMAERLGRAAVTGREPQQRVHSAAVNIWRSASRHRNVTALASSIGATTLLELPLEVALLAELEQAGVRGAAARDALATVLACVAGFLVTAWRPPEERPDGLRPSQIWATVDDPRIPRATVRAVSGSVDLDRLAERALLAVVVEHLGATAERKGGGR
ncbi:MAG: TetR family transcriptional regulator [Actinobacteria bacterium]|nr:TetR family transcriptional regulator [Actinomycetota bacterium]